MKKKRLKRWLRALEIAKCLFEDEWYHTRYLEEIEQLIKEVAKMIKETKLQISSFNDLLESLPRDQQTQTVIENLSIVYRDEIIRMLDYARAADQPFITLLPFKKNGHQLMAEFWVNDLALARKEKYNFHGQNISQWVYAGCIVIQDGQVSTHH